MVISILTLFPEVLKSFFDFSIIQRAQKSGLVKINLINIRNFAQDNHKTVDDKPFGGGVGMLLKIDVISKALEFAKIQSKSNPKIILTDPSGRIFNQQRARQLVKIDHLILICGHYEGIDARINNFVDETLSIGKFVLTGGELPSAIITDAVTRLIPGVLSKKDAIKDESFSISLKKEAPQFTRPYNFKGFKVPEILLSGNHKKIKNWKKENSL